MSLPLMLVNRDTKLKSQVELSI